LTQGSTEKLRQELAGSFGGVADDYERARPGYPRSAIEEITRDRPGRILDIGAGTGKLTRQLHALGFYVVGVEPSLQMLQRLRRVEKEIPTIAGRAEALPCRTASFDVVTVAQAWHWFDPVPATAEMARVLRPGGHACILRNLRDESVDWVAELSTIIGSEGTTEAESDSDPLAGGACFSSWTRQEYRLEQTLDRDLLLSLVTSRSYVVTLPQDERRVVLDRVVELCKEHPQLAGREQFTMPYQTLLFRAGKLG
jgi:ubiquinone/menaquinone biosynthesis C-methylase UbiE